MVDYEWYVILWLVGCCVFVDELVCVDVVVVVGCYYDDCVFVEVE